jgi:hypothetical protein
MRFSRWVIEPSSGLCGQQARQSTVLFAHADPSRGRRVARVERLLVRCLLPAGLWSWLLTTGSSRHGRVQVTVQAIACIRTERCAIASVHHRWSSSAALPFHICPCACPHHGGARQRKPASCAEGAYGRICCWDGRSTIPNVHRWAWVISWLAVPSRTWRVEHSSSGSWPLSCWCLGAWGHLDARTRTG